MDQPTPVPPPPTRRARISAWFGGLPPNVRGAAWMVIGALAFTIVSVLVKILGQRLDPIQVAFFRASFGLLFLMPLMVRLRFAPFRTKRLGGHFWRAVLGVSGMVTSNYAFALLPLADATAIAFSTPLFVVIVAVLFFGEKVRWRRWTATAVGFVGVMIMARPGHSEFGLGMAMAIGSAVISAGAVSVVKAMTATEGTLTMLAGFSVFSTLFTLVPAVLLWQTPTLVELGMAVALGIVATLGQSCLIKAYTAGEATAVAPFDYLRLPFAGLLGFFLFAEQPDIWTGIGALIIIGSTLYIARREARLGKELPPAARLQKKLP